MSNSSSDSKGKLQLQTENRRDSPPSRDRNNESPPALPERNTPPRRGRKVPSGPNPFFGEAPERNVPRSPIDLARTQPFWKFHILKFGSCLYLTTNPTLRHLHCRNAPGYFVRISGRSLGFTMVFEDITTGEPLVKVDKLTDRQSNQFLFQVRKNRFMKDGRIQSSAEFQSSGICSSFNPAAIGGIDPDSGVSIQHETRNLELKNDSYTDWSDAFRDTLTREPIPSALLPRATETPMLNYCSLMVDGLRWNVGSIPRYRESKISSQDTKYVGKKHVYFHRSFLDLDRALVHDVPPALAVFRECESGTKKRAMRQLNRLSRVGSELTQKSRHHDPIELSPFSEVTTFYKCGDGVYNDKVPTDDEPDYHHKLGWVTVYDESHAFCKSGMFDLVVALTVALGYERSVTFGSS